MAYQEPDWAEAPPSTNNWSLVELKGGVQVAQHPLSSQACTILGRAADMVHIPLHHESASRQHARIAFDAQGIPWLKDLKSTHGTTCNKRPLPALASASKQESNSFAKGARGVMLFPGDMLKFGASTRLYLLEGPPEFEQGAVNAKLQQQKLLQTQEQEQQQQQVTAVAPQEDDNEVSWGIDMEEEDAGESSYNTANNTNDDKTIPMDAQVPEKHRKALERLNAMKYKLTNLETEDGKIRRKGELTEGQERQLQRNAEREQTLNQSIVNLETELYDKLHPGNTNKSKRKAASGSLRADDNEDDDFFDRTKQRNNGSVIGNDESEATLISKWKRFQQEHNTRHEVALPKAEGAVDRLTSRHNDFVARGEDEEAFYIQNDLQLAQEILKKILTEDKDASSKLAEIERLLRIVNPKIQSDRKSGYIGAGSPPLPKSVEAIATKQESARGSFSGTMMMPPPVRATPASIEFSMQPPPLPPPPMAHAPVIETPLSLPMEPNSPQAVIMPPPKRTRVVGPSMPAPQDASEVASARPSKQNPSTEKKFQNSTLSFLSSMTKMKKPEAEADAKTGASSNAKSKVIVDPKKDEWRAPEGQDGSGITKLNAKFAGRY